MGILIGAAVAAAAAFVLIALLRRGGGRDGYGEARIGDRLRRFKANKQRYAVMTETLLRETDEAMLVEAVLSNLWAKMADDLSDAQAVLAGETQGRRYIFALYAVTGAVGQDGFGALLRSADAAFVPTCAEALEAIGLAGCARTLRDAAGAGEAADSFSTPYLECFDAEDGRDRMARYIREHAREFCDMV